MNEIFGGIIGDIAGSTYEISEVVAKKSNGVGRPFEERTKILDKSFTLFAENSKYTDDSILTFAICNAILTNTPYAENIINFGKKELDAYRKNGGRSPFGKHFISWLDGESEGNSFGNGSSMRISPIGYCYKTLDETLTETEKATICSHNNIDAINCAKAVSGAIFLARNKKTKEDIKNFCEKYFSCEFDLEKLQKNYTFSSEALKSVPESIFCFLDSNSFEDCLRKSLSIGGDSDTIACISCSIASAFYGIPNQLVVKAKSYLSKEYLNILENFAKKYNN